MRELAMRATLTAVLSLSICGLVSYVEGAEVRELIAKLKDKDSDVRRAAAKELSELGADARGAVPELTKAMRDKDLFVRRFAAEALGNVGADARSAVSTLALAMNDERKEVQLAAVAALGKIGPDSITALVAAVNDTSKDPSIRKKAAEALGTMGLRARGAVRTLANAVTGKTVSTKPAKKKGKNLEDDDVRTAAAVALGSVAKPEDKTAIDALKSVSEGKQRNKALKKAASDSLRKLTGEAPAKKKKKKGE
jgi:HEAT repeat protein